MNEKSAAWYDGAFEGITAAIAIMALVFAIASTYRITALEDAAAAAQQEGE